MNPVRNLQKTHYMKREWRIATSYSARSASSATGNAHLVDAMHFIIRGKFLTG